MPWLQIETNKGEEKFTLQTANNLYKKIKTGQGHVSFTIQRPTISQSMPIPSEQLEKCNLSGTHITLYFPIKLWVEGKEQGEGDEKTSRINPYDGLPKFTPPEVSKSRNKHKNSLSSEFQRTLTRNKYE